MHITHKNVQVLVPPHTICVRAPYTSELLSFQSYQVTSHRICFPARPGPFSSVYVGIFLFSFPRRRLPISASQTDFIKAAISVSDIKSTTASHAEKENLSAPRPTAGPLSLWALEKTVRERGRREEKVRKSPKISVCVKAALILWRCY